MGWFRGVLENIPPTEITPERFQFREELKEVYPNMELSEAPGRNTGWVFGGADTFRLEHPVNTPTPNDWSIMNPSPQLTISTSFNLSCEEEVAKFQRNSPSNDTLCNPAEANVWLRCTPESAVSVMPSPQSIVTEDWGVIRASMRFSFGWEVLQVVTKGKAFARESACSSTSLVDTIRTKARARALQELPKMERLHDHFFRSSPLSLIFFVCRLCLILVNFWFHCLTSVLTGSHIHIDLNQTVSAIQRTLPWLNSPCSNRTHTVSVCHALIKPRNLCSFPFLKDIFYSFKNNGINSQKKKKEVIKRLQKLQGKKA